MTYFTETTLTNDYWNRWMDTLGIYFCKEFSLNSSPNYIKANL